MTISVLAIFGALLNQHLAQIGDGRLSFVLLFPAILIGGFLAGLRGALVAATIGAVAIVGWHPEMTDGRSVMELGAVGSFLLLALLTGILFQRLHRLRGVATEPLIPLPPEPMTWRAWAGIAVALAVALSLSLALSAHLKHHVPFLFLYPVVAIAGYLGGWRPAVAVGFAGTAILYVWHPALPMGDARSAIVCTIFLLGTGLMGWLSEELHRSRVSARAGAAALRDLPEAQARFAAIAQTSPDAIWIWDASAGRVVYVSRACEKLTGQTPKEFCATAAKAAWEQIHPEDAPIVTEALRALESVETGRTVEFEVRHRHRNGSWRWLRNRTVVFARTATGAVAQVFGYSEDVTDRREAAERMAAQTAELARVAAEREVLLEAERAARAEAERANRLKDEFLATVSHELRTPLTAMLGWTALLSESAQEPEVQEGLEVITRNAKAQRQLVEDLLDMSRIVSGKLRLEIRPVFLPQVVRAALEVVAPAAEARGVTLMEQLDDFQEPIHADTDRLQQVIWNLLSNAVKFTPAGGQVAVRARCTDREAIITVADTGQGMAPEFLPHVFERFRQEDAKTTRKAGGLGLGLAIVKHLVELHGGTITAHSDGLGKGATFTVTLPSQSRPVVRFHGTASAEESAAAAAAAAPTALAGRRLLVIDDEADTRSYLHRLLTDRGAQVAVAESAADGLRRALEEIPDAIICDISMPGEDGYSFIRQLRRAEAAAGRRTPVAAVTALARAEDRERVLAADFDEHCPKPVDPGELLALMTRLLK